MSNDRIPNLAVQMYSLRDLTQPLGEVLREVAATGYSGIETVGTQGVSAAELKNLVDEHDLEVVSSHVGFADLEADLEGIIAAHKTLGNDTLIAPSLPAEARLDRASDWQALGERLGKLAVACSDAGMKLLYHNHDFEMQLVDGKVALEWLVEGAGDALGLELDLAWVVRGQQDPLDMLQTFSSRVKRVHVKDIAPAGENQDEDGWADVGSGTISWDALLPASKAAGTEWFVVEHDQPKDPLASVRNSADYLRSKL